LYSPVWGGRANPRDLDRETGAEHIKEFFVHWVGSFNLANAERPNVLRYGSPSISTSTVALHSLHQTTDPILPLNGPSAASVTRTLSLFFMFEPPDRVGRVAGESGF
jgi:hypothetical protein